MTSAVTASLLKSSAGSSNNVVKVWDKAKGVGGRMSTSRSPFNPDLTADLGAQYFTKTPASKKSYFDELTTNGLLIPLSHDIQGQRPNPSGSEDFVTPKGCSSIVKHFFAKAEIKVQTEHHVSNLQKVNDDTWQVSTANGVTDDFDVVILTMPVPQILALDDAMDNSLIPNHLEKNLKAVKYSSRYAMALFYEEVEEGFNFLADDKSGICAKYIDNDPIFRYLSVDTVKRCAADGNNSSSKGGVSIVLHTTVPFGVKHVEKTPDEMKPVLMEKIRELFPDWPEPKSVKCQKWRYSQASQPYDGSPGCVTLSQRPLLIAGGDAFASSLMNGCLISAEEIAKQVEHYCNSNNS